MKKRINRLTGAYNAMFLQFSTAIYVSNATDVSMSVLAIA
jgi:hypothetical protein